MVGGQIQVHRADGIGRAHERKLFGLGQVAQVDEAELAEGDQDAGGAGIFGCVHGPLGLGGAIGIGNRLDAGNRSNVLAVGGQNDNLEAGDRNGVAGMDDAPRLAFDGLQVGGVIGAGDVGVLAIHAVVQELAYGDALDQLRQSAHVVVMEVRGQQMVDARDAGVAHGSLDAHGVAPIGGGPAGVDEQRCARRGHQQRGLAAFHIDGVDEQVLLCCRGLPRCGLRLGSKEQRQRAGGKRQNAENARQRPAAESSV